ncbi:hypothetical protein ACOSP7_023080 [Xanthoceras sorbifolium]
MRRDNIHVHGSVQNTVLHRKGAESVEEARITIPASNVNAIDSGILDTKTVTAVDGVWFLGGKGSSGVAEMVGVGSVGDQNLPKMRQKVLVGANGSSGVEDIGGSRLKRRVREKIVIDVGVANITLRGKRAGSIIALTDAQMYKKSKQLWYT